MESESIAKWNNSTKKLTLGVSFATVLLFLYNVIIFLPSKQDDSIENNNMLLIVGFLLVLLALCYFCIINYCRGLSRFAVNFENGGKRALWMIRWAFLLTLAGVVMQLLIFRVFAMDTVTFGQLIIGNVLWLAATVMGIVGFLSLATAKGMTDDGRKGAVHMAGVLIVIFIGACLVSFVLQSDGIVKPLLKMLTLVVNIIGTCLFFREWKRMIMPAKETATIDNPTEEHTADNHDTTE
jgi:hypothetical protein